VLEVLGEQVVEAVILRVCPQVSVEPRKVVGSGSSKRRPHDRIVRVENRILSQNLFRFPSRLLQGEE
jgi:hypothetical protein